MGSRPVTSGAPIGSASGERGGSRYPAAIFPKLQAGQHGLAPELVRADQRARIQAAMVHAVAEQGFGAATVSAVLARAGVSRRTFYEHWADKHACFVDTYDSIVAGWTERAVAVHRATPGWRASLRASLAAVFDQVVADPLGAEIVFVAALSAGGTALQRRSRAIAAFEWLVRRSFERAPGGARMRPAMVTVTVGGVRTVIENRLRDGRLGELPSLVDPLVDWMLSYRSAVAAETLARGAVRRSRVARPVDGAEPVQAAPRLWQDASARPVVPRTPRERILDAATEIVGSRGYGALSVAEICRVARTSRSTFNALFAGSADAFLAAYDAGARRTIECSGEAFLAAPDWPSAVCAALAAHNRFLAGHESIARIGFLEVYPAGPEAVKRLDTALQFFRDGLLRADGQIRRAMPPAIVPEAIGGGIFELMRGVVLHRGAAELPSVLADSVYAALAPYIGAKAAAARAVSA